MLVGVVREGEYPEVDGYAFASYPFIGEFYREGVVMGQWPEPSASESKTMPWADKLFYVVSGAFLVIFGTGL